MLRALANSAIHPSDVGKWVVIHVIRYMDYGVKAYRGRSGRSMPAGSICGSRIRYAGYGRCLACAAPGYYSQCWSDTTSTCKAPLARASRVKWRYTKYLALTFNPPNYKLSKKVALASQIYEVQMSRVIILQLNFSETLWVVTTLLKSTCFHSPSVSLPANFSLDVHLKMPWLPNCWYYTVLYRPMFTKLRHLWSI